MNDIKQLTGVMQLLSKCSSGFLSGNTSHPLLLNSSFILEISSLLSLENMIYKESTLRDVITLGLVLVLLFPKI